MPKPTIPVSRLFKSLGADDSYSDARAKAIAKDAQQRWPMFKDIAPQSGEAISALTEAEKACWEQVAVMQQDEFKPVLSRPGLGNKLSIGLGKIARQTSVEVLGGAKRDKPVAPPLPEVRVSQPALRQEEPVAASSEPLEGLFASQPKPDRISRLARQTPAKEVVSEKRGVFGAPPAVPEHQVTVAQRASRRETSAAVSSGGELTKQVKRVPAASKGPLTPSPSAAADDSLSSIFRRVEGGDKPPARRTAPRKNVMSRLGKR